MIFRSGAFRMSFYRPGSETKVTVYGTRFNLFYSDRLTVTEAVLVEGSIGLMAGGKETKIRPNQRIRYRFR